MRGRKHRPPGIQRGHRTMEQQAGINSTVESGEGSATSRLCGSLAKLINNTPGTGPGLCRQPQTATFTELECPELTQARRYDS